MLSPSLRSFGRWGVMCAVYFIHLFTSQFISQVLSQGHHRKCWVPWAWSRPETATCDVDSMGKIIKANRRLFIICFPMIKVELSWTVPGTCLWCTGGLRLHHPSRSSHQYSTGLFPPNASSLGAMIFSNSSNELSDVCSVCCQIEKYVGCLVIVSSVFNQAIILIINIHFVKACQNKQDLP